MEIKLTHISKFFICAFLLLTSCNLPKDPESSWEKAKSNDLKVGVIDNPPYTKISENSFSGAEIDIINKFASSNDLKVTYIEGNETDLIEKLEKFKIDIIVGGFDKKTVWSKKAGISKAYDKKHVFLVPKGENNLLVKLEEYIHQNFNNEKS